MQKERESECNHEIHIDHLEYEINDEQWKDCRIIEAETQFSKQPWWRRRTNMTREVLRLEVIRLRACNRETSVLTWVGVQITEIYNLLDRQYNNKKKIKLYILI
jgi:hypothetical protein